MFGKKSSNKAKSIPATVEAATLGSSGYPGELSVASLRERRFLASLRIVAGGLLASLILNIVLGFLLVSLFPLKEIRPFLVQVAEEGTVVAAIRPIQDTFEAKDVLTEKLVREYTVVRNEILRSSAVMAQRWAPTGTIGMMTESAEYRRFAEGVRPVLEEIRTRGGERRVDIISVNALTAGQIYIVDFRTTFYDESNRPVEIKTYTATIEISFKTLSDLTREQMLINPTGFTVVSHTLAEKNQ